jgi:hypothetical protein
MLKNSILIVALAVFAAGCNAVTIPPSDIKCYANGGLYFEAYSVGVRFDGAGYVFIDESGKEVTITGSCVMIEAGE